MNKKDGKKLFISKKIIIALVFVVVIGSCSAVFGLKSNASKNPEQLDFTEYETGLEPISNDELEWLDENAVEINNAEDYYNYVDGKEVGCTDNSESSDSAPTDETNATSAYEFPAQVDNSTSKYFPPIGDQGSIGSCCSWANTYYQMTYMYNKAMDRDSSLAKNQFSPMWTYEMCGGNEVAISRMLIQMGASPITTIPAETWYPDDKNTLFRLFATDDIWKEATNYRLESVYEIQDPIGCDITNPQSEALDEIKAALDNGEILTFSTDVYKWRKGRLLYDSTDSNYNGTSNNKFSSQYIVGRCDCSGGGLHRMTIVGYDDNIWYDINENGVKEDGEMGAFKIANSWGDAWCNRGFIWLSYDALNSSSSVNENSAVTLTNNRRAAIYDIIGYKIKDKTTDIYAEFTLNTLNRGEVDIDIIAQDDDNTYKYDVLEFSYYGPRIGFDGTENTTDGNFAVALDNVINDISSEDIKNMEWKVRIEDLDANDTNVTVKDVKIVDNTANKTYTQNVNKEFVVDSTYKNAVVSTFNESSNNTTTIYYKGYSNPNIHYQVAGQNWTDVPGVVMQATSEMNGYTHKYVIDLGTASSAQVCFNDGNNNWDSNNGSNFTFGAGVYTYSSGNINKISNCTTNFAADLIADTYDTALVATPITLTAKTAGANGTVSYKFGYILDGTEITIKDYSTLNTAQWAPTKGASYTLFVDAKDSTGKTVRKCLYDYNVCSLSIAAITKSLNAPQRAGTNITLGAITKNEVIKSSNKSSYVYEVTLNGVTTKLTTNSDNTANWTPTQKGTYKIKVTVTDGVGQTVSLEEDYKIKDQDASLKVEDISLSSYSQLVKGSSPQVFVDIDGGSGEYTLTFGYISTDGEDVATYSNYASQYLSLPTPYVGNTKYFVSVTDSEGTNVRYEKTFEIKGCEIAEIKVSPEDYAYIGDTVEIATTTKYEINYRGLNHLTYTITNNDTGEVVTYTSSTSSCYSCSWIPTSAGKYTVDLALVTYGSGLLNTSFEYEVKEKQDEPAEDNTLTLYYKGYSNPYVHYRIGNGNWTNIPGIAMEASTEVSGYTHKIVLDLGEEITATLCFNDGNNNWDSNNGLNYTFTKGNYGYYNGKIKDLDADDNGEESKNTTTIYYSGYSAPFIHYKVGSGSWTTAPGFQMEATSELSDYTHKIVIDLGDETTITACFNDGNGNWDSNFGNNYTFGAGKYTFSGGVISSIE